MHSGAMVTQQARVTVVDTFRSTTGADELPSPFASKCIIQDVAEVRRRLVEVTEVVQRGGPFQPNESRRGSFEAAEPRRSSFHAARMRRSSLEAARESSQHPGPAQQAEADGCSTSSAGLGNLERTPSHIPTEINLPEKVFGRQINPASNVCNPPIVPFPTYCACRLLDTTPENPGNRHIYEALRTMSAYYLRADAEAICDCIQAFGLNSLLYNVARLEDEQAAALAQMNPSRNGHSMSGLFRFGSGSSDELDELEEKMRAVVGVLMHELECILHEYLSFNWDRLGEVLAANEDLLSSEGLSCRWDKSQANLANMAEGKDEGEDESVDESLSGGGSMRDLSEYGSLGSSPYLSSFGDYGISRRPSLEGVESSSGSFSTPRGHPTKGSPSEAFRRSLGSSPNLGTSPGNSNGFLGSPPGTSHGELGGRAGMSVGTGNGAGNGNGAASGAPRPQGMRKSRSGRAMINWQKARRAVSKRVTMDMLGAKKRFQTLYEIFDEPCKAGSGAAEGGSRQPVLLLLGGGMAAGKSTVREIIGHDDFWSKVGRDAVVVEADAIKNRELLHAQRNQLYRMNSCVSHHLHEYSTKKAEEQLVEAVKLQKDIVFDGTMTWAPFVEQTIVMVRDHQHNYKRGPGYVEELDGSVTERYWEIDDASPLDTAARRPYRIELVGVTCDAGLAVARGIWRKIRTGRSVPVASQLRSHRLFSENWELLAMMVDSATLYHTGSALTTFNKGNVNLTPKVIAHRSSATLGEMLVNPAPYEEFKAKRLINDAAACRNTLYVSNGCSGSVPVSHDGQMSLLRKALQAADRHERKKHSSSGDGGAGHGDGSRARKSAEFERVDLGMLEFEFPTARFFQ